MRRILDSALRQHTSDTDLGNMIYFTCDGSVQAGAGKEYNTTDEILYCGARYKRRQVEFRHTSEDLHSSRVLYSFLVASKIFWFSALLYSANEKIIGDSLSVGCIHPDISVI